MRTPRLSICPSLSHSAKTPRQLRYSSPQRTRRAHLLLRSKCASARLRRAPNRFPRKTICAPRNIQVSLSALRGVSPSEKYQKAIKEALNKSRHAPCLHIFCLTARKLLEIHQVFLRRFHTIKRKICLRNLHTRSLKAAGLQLFRTCPAAFNLPFPLPLRQNAAPVTIQLTPTHAARAFAPAEQMRFCAASPRTKSFSTQNDLRAAPPA